MLAQISADTTENPGCHWVTSDIDIFGLDLLNCSDSIFQFNPISGASDGGGGIRKIISRVGQ